MGSGFFSGLSKILKKNVKDGINSESLKNLGKLANTDVTDLMGDVKAASLLSQIEKDPEKIENYIQLAELYKYYKKLEKAVDVYLGVAHRYLEQKNPSQTIYFINLGLKIMPEHGPLNMFSADMDIRMGRFSDAPDKYRKAADYFIRKNDPMTALYLFRRIKDMNKATTKDLLNMSSLLIRENMCGDALNILLPLNEKLKDNSEQTLKDKEACLMMLHSLKKEDTGILVDLVETRIEMKQFERAVILIKKLVSNDPENINLLKRQAFVYKQMGDMENYIRTFRIIANIYSKEGNIVYRNIYFHKILKHLPNDVEALTVLKMEDQLRENIDSKIENTDSKIKMVDN
ncbi:MAG TPA: hypothetical protein PLW78_10825 [bacterium]|nr:hypothetical protein [bacterium]